MSPEWKSKVGAGTSVNWPVGLGGKGNEGVTGLVKQTPGAIGYVELAYAIQNKLAVAELKNKDGNWVKAVDREHHRRRPRASRCRPTSACRSPTPPGKDAYPIAGFT